MTWVVFLAGLGGYTLYRRRHVSDLSSGPIGHFEPMVQTSSRALEMIFDDTQADQEEQKRIVETLQAAR